MIRIQNINKRFKKLYALKDINAVMQKGQVISLIGPNGSGKTTLIKSILGLVKPDTGKIFFNDVLIDEDISYKKQIGYMPQIGRYPDNMKIGQLFSMIRNLRKSDKKDDEELFYQFKLDTISDKTLRSLSGGTRQKVSAALAFLFDADVLILDEPTAGLDPLSAEMLKEKILSEKEKGKLILITSHILSDLEELTTDVIYMQEGSVIFYRTLADIQQETGEEKLSKAIAWLMKHSLLFFVVWFVFLGFFFLLLKLSKYVLYDILRNKIMIAYALFLFIISMSLFQMEENSSKAVLSLLNIVLIVIPLVSMVFSTIHWYNSYEFIELMLTQPLSRKKLILSEYIGISSSLVTAFFIGVGIPVCIY
jgi:Cu-processing system ATP-binding protein